MGKFGNLFVKVTLNIKNRQFECRTFLLGVSITNKA